MKFRTLVNTKAFLKCRIVLEKPNIKSLESHSTILTGFIYSHELDSLAESIRMWKRKDVSKISWRMYNIYYILENIFSFSFCFWSQNMSMTNKCKIVV